MTQPSKATLKQFLDAFTDISVIPVALSSALLTYYEAIANDPELARTATLKCKTVLKEYSNYNPEVVTRCSQFQTILDAPKTPQNLILEHTNLQTVTDTPFISSAQHMANLIVEEIDLADYIDDNDN
ncbi:LADA_0H17546g1_1 [Lachancea dasiensis]|uniref:Nucleolar protein SWM2 n=1 Tax=Lachancea dasiensis TaxID=1072105 RepID=A0A1G4K5L6_9SACH|nr:LADA_0H17546g1_1 [Lachancea dasiensis]